MTTQELKAKLQGMYPLASRIKVRQYPMTYKGSMRGYTDIVISNSGDSWHDLRDKVKAIVPDPKHTFVSM